MGRKTVPKFNGEMQRGPSQNSRTHGLNTLKRAVKELGSRTIDKRTKYGRALYVWRGQLIDDMGGEHTVTAAQLQVIDSAIKTKLMLDSVDAYILGLGDKIINKRNRCLYPVVQQRSVLANDMLRFLSALGLERRAASVPTLESYIEARAE